MPCDPTVFEEIPIFSLLDADERAVLAEQVELRTSSEPGSVSTNPAIPAARRTSCSGARCKSS